jgi:hypothetical protein
MTDILAGSLEVLLVCDLFFDLLPRQRWGALVGAESHYAESPDTEKLLDGATLVLANTFRGKEDAKVSFTASITESGSAAPNHHRMIFSAVQDSSTSVAICLACRDDRPVSLQKFNCLRASKPCHSAQVEADMSISQFWDRVETLEGVSFE